MNATSTTALVGALVIVGAVLAGNHVAQQSAMADLRKQISDARQEMALVKGLQLQIAEVKEHAVSFRSEQKRSVADLRAQLVDAQQVLNVVGLKNEIADMKGDAAAFRAGLDDAKGALLDLKADSKRSNGTSSALHAELENAQTLLSRLETQAKASESDAGALRKTLEDTKRGAETVLIEVDGLQKKLASLKIATTESWRMTRLKVMELLNSNPYPNLSGFDLSGLDLSGVDFRSASLYRTNFNGANLTGADFSTRVELLHTYHHNARSDPVPASTTSRDIDLRYASLQNADLKFANFSGTNTTTVNLAGAKNLAHIWNMRAQSSMLNLEGVDLTGANFTEGTYDLRRSKSIDLSGVDLASATLYVSGVDCIHDWKHILLTFTGSACNWGCGVKVIMCPQQADDLFKRLKKGSSENIKKGTLIVSREISYNGKTQDATVTIEKAAARDGKQLIDSNHVNGRFLNNVYMFFESEEEAAAAAEKEAKKAEEEAAAAAKKAEEEEETDEWDEL